MAGLANISDDELTIIASHLDLLSLTKLCQTNREISRLCKQNYFWYVFSAQHGYTKDPYDMNLNYRDMFAIFNTIKPVAYSVDITDIYSTKFLNDPMIRIYYDSNGVIIKVENKETRKVIYSSGVANATYSTMTGEIVTFPYGSVCSATEARKDYLYAVIFGVKIKSQRIPDVSDILKEYWGETQTGICYIPNLPTEEQIGDMLQKMTPIYSSDVDVDVLLNIGGKKPGKSYIEPDILKSRKITSQNKGTLPLIVGFDMYSIRDQYIFIVFLGSHYYNYARSAQTRVHTHLTPIKDIYTSTDDTTFNNTVLHLLPRIVRKDANLCDNLNDDLHITINRNGGVKKIEVVP